MAVLMILLMYVFISAFCNGYGARKVGRMLILLLERVLAPQRRVQERSYMGNICWRRCVWIEQRQLAKYEDHLRSTAGGFLLSSPSLNSGLDAYALSLSSFAR